MILSGKTAYTTKRPRLIHPAQQPSPPTTEYLKVKYNIINLPPTITLTSAPLITWSISRSQMK